MAAEDRQDSRSFFAKATLPQWKFILSVYKDAVRLKAQQKNKKPEELLKLDSWYQEELPKTIQSRKEKHITHDELVQVMKWKLARGKFIPQLTNLVRINTPLLVFRASKKAFKRLPNLTRAIQSLTSLKGVGPAMASAVLAAAAPECAPFMADECLMCLPNVESIDYTVQEYLSFAQQLQGAAARLNECEKSRLWTPHRVELALWTHYIIRELNPSMLSRMAEAEDAVNAQNGKSGIQTEDMKSTCENGEDSSASTSKSDPDDEGIAAGVEKDQSKEDGELAKDESEEEPPSKRTKTD